MTSPLTTGSSNPPARVLVRYTHSDEATWRGVFGPTEFLHCWSCDGSMGARDVMPAGSTVATERGAKAETAWRAM